MPYFIKLVSFTSEGHKDMKNFPGRRAGFLAQAEKLKIKVIAEYVTAGRFDIVTILEAPDLDSVLKLSAITGSTGRTHSETLSAISAADFEKITESI